MNCRQFIDSLDDYVAEAQTPPDRAGAESHLAVCPYCRDYLKTYRDTIALLHKSSAAEPEPPIPDDLSRALAETLRRARSE